MTTVTTESSVYVIDYHDGIVTRHPIMPDASDLRRDGDPVTLIRVLHCQIGEPMKLLLDVREDGVLTVRTTTPVQAIEE